MHQPKVSVLRPLLPILLLGLSADLAECQTGGATGPGKAAPWSVEGTPTPPQRPEIDVRHRDRDWKRREFWNKNAIEERRLQCRILEVEDLGRIYVEDVSGGSPYWIQLPEEVKIRTTDRASFGGRGRLKLEDLAAGQLLVITLRRRDGEILVVRVLPQPRPKKVASATSETRTRP